MLVRRPVVTLSIVALSVVAIGSMAAWWRMEPPPMRRPRAAGTLRGSGQLTMAFTGDSLVVRRLPVAGADRGFDGVVSILHDASLAATNLEENLLEPSGTAEGQTPGAARWPHGGRQAAEDLERVGFSVVSCANNHATDFGVSGMQQTRQNLDLVGLLRVGCGDDLEQARAPVFAGGTPRRVAFLAVATSATAESRATSTRADFKGRSGVSALRYKPDVTVDPATFAVLKQSLVGMQAGSASGDQELTFYGTPIRKGPQTVVDIVGDERDIDEVLAEVKAARADADVVVVMVHSHEPSNHSQVPADFVRRFARQAIDNGASLVVGHGPHQLRGVEVYKQGAILYSLGNFAFDYQSVDVRSADVYESGTDLYRLALGAIPFGEPASRTVPDFDEPSWWESVIAVTSFEGGRLASLWLQPIDLGADLDRAARGTPRLASPERGIAILQRLASLSKALGTQMHVENGRGTVDLTPEGGARPTR